MVLERYMYFYDEYCKEVLSFIQITSRILKYFVSEYQNCKVDDIIQLIYSQQNSREHKVQLLNTEKIQDKEAIHYDLLFKSQFPDGRVAYFDVEAQNADGRASLHRRSEMYAGFRFVSQKGVECHPPLYTGLKPFYQVWIGKRCDRKKSRIKLEKMIEKDMLTGEVGNPPYIYQKRIYILLGSEPSDNPGIRLLQILFSGDYRSDEINDCLEKEFGFRLRDKEMEVIHKMCNFSESIRNRGLVDGRIEGKEMNMVECIRNLMINLNLSVNQAMSALNISEEETDKYLNLLQ